MRLGLSHSKGKGQEKDKRGMSLSQVMEDEKI